MTSPKKQQSEHIRELIEQTAKLSPGDCLCRDIDDMLTRVGSLPGYKTKKAEYLNAPCSFDIETTSFYENGEKRALMYVWQFGLCGYVVMGRTWPEFVNLVSVLSSRLQLDEHRRLICYVHNLAFEFQFMRGWFDWLNVFAVAPREPVYALTSLGVEFRCSYILSGYALARLGDGLNRYKISKLVGDLDYSVLRHSLTPLTDTERDYCINDVRVVMAYIQEQIDRYGNITRLQLTKTGYVRKYCRDSCMYAGSHKKSTWKALNYRAMMSRLTIEPDEYRMLKRAFQGGFTHANAYYTGEVLNDVESQDFTSSYPAVMFTRNSFPMSKGELVTIHNEREFRDNIKKYCCVFDVRFHGLCIRENVPDCPISRSKCYNVAADCVENNGRVAMCSVLTTTITEVDFNIYEKFYTWDTFEIGRCYRYRRGYLPTDFIKAILNLYADKTTLKGVDGREEDYALSKEMLNSCYGMIVTDICRDENTYNGEWVNKPADIDAAIEKYNNDPKRFLFYPWGIYVTAWARHNLFTGIYALGNDFIYADTDSVKYLNPEKHAAYFEAYNNSVIERIKRACAFHKIPLSAAMPKTIKGVEKPLGVWDAEGKFDRFKTLGAKRYAVEKNGQFNITVSGVNKKTAVPYLVAKYKDPFSAFNDGLTIPKGATGKLTHTYIDCEFGGFLRDFRGIECEYHEKSAVHMEQCEYSMNLSIAYLDYLLGYREKSK